VAPESYGHRIITLHAGEFEAGEESLRDAAGPTALESAVYRVAKGPVKKIVTNATVGSGEGSPWTASDQWSPGGTDVNGPGFQTALLFSRVSRSSGCRDPRRGEAAGGHRDS
jgi:hypothetical protein